MMNTHACMKWMESGDNPPAAMFSEPTPLTMCHVYAGEYFSGLVTSTQLGVARLVRPPQAKRNSLMFESATARMALNPPIRSNAGTSSTPAFKAQRHRRHTQHVAHVMGAGPVGVRGAAVVPPTTAARAASWAPTSANAGAARDEQGNCRQSKKGYVIWLQGPQGLVAVWMAWRCCRRRGAPLPAGF